MSTKASTKQLPSKNLPLTVEELEKKLSAKLLSRGVTDPASATPEQLYQAVVYLVKDVLNKNRTEFKRRTKAAESKRVCYLCMEFLIGRSLKNNLLNLGMFDSLGQVLGRFGRTFDEVFACEIDPGLGNGGLGRLAACFMDSLTALDYFASGYSLLYENGLFRQKLVDGEQVEIPDEWIEKGGAWLIPRPEKSVNVRFGGQIKEEWKNGRLTVENTEYDEVRAVAYDLMIPGTETNAVNTLRLWRAKDVSVPTFAFGTQGDYVKSLEGKNKAEEITRQLYPPDNYDEGKLLRLTQQYFLVSASLQSIFSDYYATYGSLAGFSDKISIHINDTHPALCVPELMRILMDVYSYSWEDAWETVVKTVSYTNHTVLPEALECWRVDLFRLRLPRIYTIVEEINRRFCANLWELYPGDWDRISRMAIVAYGQVRMANLSVVGSHTVNGVSALHSDILKKTVFHDFYKMTPWKFTNVTNGVFHRRWLASANPKLTSLITESIGGGFIENPEKLAELERFSTDSEMLKRLGEVKHANKERFAKYVLEKTGRTLDPSSVFDVQVKRMHEYKRQLLNGLKILSMYQELCENPSADIPAQTFVFGAKAAAGYQMAKKLIKFLYFLGRELEANPLTRDRLKLVFMEDYNVSLAEVLIPSADISEQISLAGKEASGTGNMKLMMNGALTLGTLDGANVEILDAVGDPNIYIFGLNTYEVDELWRHGYVAREFYHHSERLRKTIDRLGYPIGGENFSSIADYLLNGGYTVADPFMCLADFDSYCLAYEKALGDYQKKEEWNRRSLINIARSGRFSSDVSIRTYAEKIWHMDPVGK